MAEFFVSEDDGSASIDLLSGVSGLSGVPVVAGVVQTGGRTASYTIVDGQLRIDPGQFNDLAAGSDLRLSFSYTVSDGVTTVPQALALTVQGRDDAPVLHAVTATTAEDAAVTVDVVAAASDPDAGDTLTLLSATLESGLGRASVVNGKLVYEPGRAYEGLVAGATAAVVISYVVADAAGVARTASATITLTGTNQAPVLTLTPVATPLTLTENVAGAVLGTITARDADMGDTLTYTVSDDRFEVVDGQLKLKSGVSLDYESEKTGSVRVTVTDGSGASAAEVLSYAVKDVNEAPIVQNDAAAGLQSTAMVVDVLANDRDQDEGDAIHLVSVELEQGRGTVRMVNGQLLYDPGTAYDGLNEGETATVVVNYVVADKLGLQSSARAVITVTGTNQAPTITFAPAGQRVLVENAAGAELGVVTVADVDVGDGLTVTLSDDRFELVGSRLKLKDGVALDYESQKSGTVKVTVSDSHGASASTDVAYTVQNVNEAPTASPDLATTREDNKVVVNVLANDRDPDAGDALTLKSVRLEQGVGSVAIVNGKLTYDPGTAYIGLREGETAQVVVSYVAVDQGGLEANATATITVVGINQPPYLTFSATGGRAALAENKAGAVLGTLTVVDPDIGDTHTYSISDNRFEVVNGKLKLKAGVSLDYETEASGVVTVKVTDAAGAWDSKDIAYQVDNMGEAVADTAAATEPAPIVIDVLANDVLPGQEGLLKVISAKVLQGGGTLTVENNKLKYDPGALQYLKEGETAEVLATYTVIDQNGSPTSATITITVTGINQAPVVADFDPVAQRLGQPFSFALDMGKITDVDRGEALTLTATLADGSPLPSWLSFDAATGMFTSAMGQATSGATRIKVTATDPHGASSSNVLTLAFYDGAVVVGTASADFVDGRSGATVNGDWIRGMAGDDSLYGSSGNDVIYGGDGNDGLNGEAGDDVLLGGAGRDWLTSSLGNDLLDGGAGDDHLQGYGGNVTLLGGEGNDALYYTTLADHHAVLDGGAGDDTIEVYTKAVQTIITGAGRDVVGIFEAGNGGHVVTDFTAGTGGDALDLQQFMERSMKGWDGVSNPFTSGYLRLLQVGPDTVVQAARATPWVFETLVTLRNVAAADLVAENFGLGYGFSPTGGRPLGQVAELVNAGGSFGAGDDVVTVRGSYVSVYAGAGNDTVFGGDGADFIDGDAGNDVLYGNAGADAIYGGGGDDTVFGGAGDDRLYGEVGNDVLFGEDGNDTLSLTNGSWAVPLDAARVTLDGGAGDDRFTVFNNGMSVSLVTGGGVDTIEVYYQLYSGATGTREVTDFSVGYGGDKLDLGYLFSSLKGWDGIGNPFNGALGYARLRQDGADAVLEYDYDGAAGASFGWTSLLTLRGVDASALTAANIVGGFSPSGAAAASLAVEGTAGDDTLYGGAGDDVIRGLAGRDAIYAGSGNDILDGGDGDDRLTAEAGNDTLYGGAGRDLLYGGAGDDTLYGGDGDDLMYGNDGNNLLVGGFGNDDLELVSGSNIANGGAGDDTVSLGSAAGCKQVITLGSGFDRLRITGFDFGRDADSTVTDFNVAEDFIDIDFLIRNYAIGWDGRGNPFSTGYMRAVQSGADTLLQFDVDGVGATYGYRTTVRLQNVTVSSLTSVNFNPSYSPDGSGIVGMTLNGTAAANVLNGGAGDDVVMAGDGADTLTGAGGNDRLDGQAGNDTLSGGTGNDTLTGGAGNDLYLFGRGDGGDVIDNRGTLGETDVVRFGAGIAVGQLWFRRVGDTLEVGIDGTTDRMALQEWYVSADNRVSAFETADGARLLAAQVENLVSAMAGMTPPPLGQYSLTTQQHQLLDGVIAAAWQPAH